jgi:hypothetical protein
MRDDSRCIYTFGYLDESGTSERWFACGVLIHGPKVSAVEDIALNQQLREAKVDSGIRLRGDLGWKKIPNRPGQYLDLYTAYVDFFFREPALSFNAIVVDTHKCPLDSRQFFRGSKDLGIDAFAIQLIRCRILRFWSGGERLYLRFDRRSRPDGATLLRVYGRLREIAKTEIRTGNPPPTLNARAVSGGAHPLVQVADLLLGSVCASANGRGLAGGKQAVIRKVADHLGRDPGKVTPPSTKKFNVWYFAP